MATEAWEQDAEEDWQRRRLSALVATSPPLPEAGAAVGQKSGDTVAANIAITFIVQV